MTLDCAQAEFLTPERAVISLKGGELYVLSLLVDGMRSVRGFHFDRAAASVLTSCLAVLEERWLFLGSRLGNSLLLQFTEKELGSVYAGTTSGLAAVGLEPPTKKKKTDDGTADPDWMASDVADIRDVDLEVYGKSDTSATSRISSYSFEVCDSLLNIGPCGHIAMGEPAFLSEEFSQSRRADPDVELVTTSGYGKNGALCVLQKSVRPQVVTTFELPGVLDVWTVVGEGEDDDEGKEDQLNESHAFLIISRADSTMILQTGQEINELDQSGFFTQGPTVFCCNMGANRYIVQVSPKDVRLLRGRDQIQHLPLELSSPICRASAADPYLLVMTDAGEIVLLTLEEEKRERGFGAQQKSPAAKLSAVKANLKGKSQIDNICAYQDLSGLFTEDLVSLTDQVSAIRMH